MRLTNKNDLKKLQKAGRSTFYPSKIKISVGMATCGLASGAGAVYDTLNEELNRNGIRANLVKTGCLGFCQQEPLVDIRVPNLGRVIYSQVSSQKARGLVDMLKDGELSAKGALAIIPDDGQDGMKTIHNPTGTPLLNELPFYKHQQKIILRNCGLVNPLSIEEYSFRKGYEALLKVLTELTPQQLIKTIIDSGLRGRGGGGFPTGKKWQLCSDVVSETKYIICNADEGDPGAYMDRTVLESDPFSVIEGLTIGGYAIGAKQGFIYVRDEYPLAIDRLHNCIERASELGLLGKNIFGTDFDFTIDIVRGAGAFVCGEETALIASIEGGNAEPRQKPPYPAEVGLWGKPTIINNVKTFTTVPEIILRGANWYSSIGVPGNTGTVVFSLVGQVANTGLVEVPLGISLQQLIQEIGGGGLKKNKPVKALQTGGPSGGCISASMFNIPIDYESLAKTGSIMGSGGMVVMDEDTCMVDVAKYFLAFTRSESCGKCTSCREGNRFLHEILKRITNGEGNMGDLDLLEEVGGWVKKVSLCGLGQTAPNPVLSTLRYFREEYIAHVKEKHCPAGVCRALISVTILPDLCNGCDICSRACPANAISGKKKEHHVIDKKLCTCCRACVDVCPEDAIEIGRLN